MAELGNPNKKMMEKLITFLSSLLEKVAESNDRLQTQEQEQEEISSSSSSSCVFHGLTKPTISVEKYLERMFKYANCSPSCFIVAYIYLDRFTQRQQSSFSINSLTIHRLLITSVMLSAKFLDDLYYNNAHYAKIGGISTKEMNILEVDFLFGLSFHLNVTPNTFHTYCTYLQREMMIMQPTIQLDKSSKLQLCFNEEEETSSHKNHQLAV